MTFQVRDQKEFLAGAIFTVIGVVWALRAMALPLGTATAMGPGYFPLVVAIVLACTGLLSVGRSLRVARRFHGISKTRQWPRHSRGH